MPYAMRLLYLLPTLHSAIVGMRLQFANSSYAKEVDAQMKAAEIPRSLRPHYGPGFYRLVTALFVRLDRPSKIYDVLLVICRNRIKIVGINI